ncbi:MAG: CRISPR-associated DxTHG motif protein [Candidatus Thorarchaeota archaeon]|nr:CRISPR-associated DxTHG motif protein [Candidatus Thorarchaeota archaeon]
MGRPERLLVTFLGTGNYDTTEYYLYPNQRNRFETNMTCAAIAHLAHPFDRIVAVTTEQSCTRLPLLRESLGQDASHLSSLTIGEPKEEKDLLDSIQTVVDILRPTDDSRVDVTLDITHAFRHMPLVFLTALNYLDCFGNAVLARVLYAQFQKGIPQTPIIDVTPSLTLVRWSQAMRTFLDTGRMDHLVELAQHYKKGLEFSDAGARKLSELIKYLRALAHPIGHALPIEIGRCVASLLSQIREVADDEIIAPLFAETLRKIGTELSPLQIEYSSAKSDVQLTEQELRRQLSVVEWFKGRNRIGDALLLLREYIVNVMLLDMSPREWLDLKARSQAEYRLSALTRLRSLEELEGLLSEDQRVLADKWNKLTQLRNRYAHAGFGVTSVQASSDRTELDELLDYCHQLHPIDLRPEAQHHRLLVSPLGLARGVLFSAIRLTEPDHVIVIASSESSPAVDDVMVHASFDRNGVQVLELTDTYIGFDEIPRIVERCRPTVALSEEVVCNVTGGTTLMGEVSRAVGNEASRLGVDTVFVALVDRRPAEVQRSNPYVVGQRVELSSHLHRHPTEASINTAGGSSQTTEE